MTMVHQDEFSAFLVDVDIVLVFRRGRDLTFLPVVADNFPWDNQKKRSCPGIFFWGLNTQTLCSVVFEENHKLECQTMGRDPLGGIDVRLTTEDEISIHQFGK
jgi:hypothetical protein